MRRALAILLTAAILVCPLLCTFAECGIGVADEANTRGCNCCHQDSAATSGDEQSSPTDSPPPDSGRDCNCICGGAVVEDTGLQFVGFDWSWSQPVVAAEQTVGQIHETIFDQFSRVPWPDVGLNTGRAFCCLYNTYQC